jgi:hypothetical protein
MGIRLLILLALAGGLAVYLGMRPASKAVPTAAALTNGSNSSEDNESDDGMSEVARREVRERQKTLSELPLSGDEPPIPPKFSVTVETNLASGKNQLCFNISEEHGYFVETMNLQFWHTGPSGADSPETSKFVWEEYINDYIEAHKSLPWCLEVVPAELSRIGGSIGTSANWAGRISWHNRARLENPDPLWPHPAKLPKTRGTVITGTVRQP